MSYNYDLFKLSVRGNHSRRWASYVSLRPPKMKKRGHWLYLTALVVTLTFNLAITAPPVYAANLTVNSTSDTITAEDGLCTLREAIINANTDNDTTGGDCIAGSGADTISFSITGAITLGSILPNITTDITISGPDAADLILDGNEAVSILTVVSTGTLNLEKLTITNVLSSGFGAIRNNGGTVTVTDSTFSNNTSRYAGGGIYNNFNGSVTITNSTFSGNSGWSYGGAIYNNAGKLTVTDSIFSNNSSPSGYIGGGGGIYNEYGTVTVTNTVFSDNTVGGYASTGGGISNDYGGTLMVANSTFSGNSSKRGGGIYNGISSTLTIANSTFSGNSASLEGGGIANEHSKFLVTITNSTFSGNSGGVFNGGGIYNLYGTMEITNSTFNANYDGINNHNSLGTVTLRNTIIANSEWVNCFGRVLDGGNNLQYPSTGNCDFFGIPSADPLLGPLQDNGGPTFTHALLEGSPAIDAVPLDDCSEVTTDQRGVARPQGSACDIGAFEFVPPNQPPVVSAGGPYTVDEGASVMVSASGSDPEGGSLTYAWDLDNDGSFESPGQSVTFSALDGPESHIISVQAVDDGGLAAIAQATVTVFNIAPVVNAGLDVTILQGQTFSENGSFNDPGLDTWMATVNYGEGMQPLSLNPDNTFYLSHSYTAAGTFPVFVSVIDDDGGVGSDVLVVTVLTPNQGIEGLIEKVHELVDRGELNKGQGNALIAKLDAAIKQLDRDNVHVVINQLQSFINEVEAMIRSGLLLPEDGQPLIDAANEIIAILRN